MKLAHFSDIHITHFPFAERLALKRLAATVSYTLMRRGLRFNHSNERIKILLDDVDAQRVDHALCTGDLTGVTLEAEMAEVAALFGPRLEQPARYTVIPGNHDRYVRSADGVFEKHFARLASPSYPLVKQVGTDVTLVAIDTARPTSVIDSSGLVGAEQLEKLKAILTDSSLKDRFVVLALHYGLLRKDGTRDKRNHGLRDDDALISLIDQPDVRLDVVLHGHLHRSFQQKTQRRLILNTGSATDIGIACGYNVLTFEREPRRIKVERRAWNAAESRYSTSGNVELNLVD